MTLHRWAKARDANEPQIVRALEAAGYSVVRIDEPCDLLAGRSGVTHCIEVKTDKGRDTPNQIEHQRTWRGCHHIATEPEALIAELRQCRAKGR
jgi:hypothetical protein